MSAEWRDDSPMKTVTPCGYCATAEACGEHYSCDCACHAEGKDAEPLGEICSNPFCGSTLMATKGDLLCPFCDFGDEP